MIKIVVTGVESSGKTTLASDLANKLDAVYVPEYSRTYLTHLHRPYVQDDLLKIAMGQMRSECEAALEKNKRLMICDTSFLVLKVWSEYKYGICDPFILERVEQADWDAFLLPHYDIPYEDDPLRENPDDRHILYDIYTDELKRLGRPFMVLYGSHEERLAVAREFVESMAGHRP